LCKRCPPNLGLPCFSLLFHFCVLLSMQLKTNRDQGWRKAGKVWYIFSCEHDKIFWKGNHCVVQKTSTSCLLCQTAASYHLDTCCNLLILHAVLQFNPFYHPFLLFWDYPYEAN